MPLHLNIKKKFSCNSERVKSIDFHTIEPWILTSLYSGLVTIWNYNTQLLLKTFQVSNLPVRNSKFIIRKEWIIASSDDLQIRVYNYNTMEKVIAFEAHTDYIRYIEIHPTLPFVLTCSDDMTIKMWDYDKNWSNINTYEGHSHYVMMMKFNPKDTQSFCSCSLDRTIKVWGINTSVSHYTLEGHERGVNCIDYYPLNDKPYLISGADDKLIKIWDYQTKSIIHTLEGHTHNLTNVTYHPRLPIIISSSEDGTVRIWHNVTYRIETTLNYGLERSWCIATLKNSNKLAIGYDEGFVLVKLGHDMPVISMENSTGKIVFCKNNNEIQLTNIKGIASEISLFDGEKVNVNVKDLGNCEIFPQYIKHNSNGRYIVVCGDGEYIVYTSQQLRNKTYGTGLNFIWSPYNTGDFLIRESTQKLKFYKNFTESNSSVKLQYSPTIENIYTGALVGVKGIDCICFYDWDKFNFVNKIDEVNVKNVYWNDTGDYVTLSCDNAYYVLKYNKELVNQALMRPGTGNDAYTPNSQGGTIGIENSFVLLHEISEKVVTGEWFNNCFIYTNSSLHLNYYLNGQINNIAHLEQKLYLLGYISKENRIFLTDKLYNIYSYYLNSILLEYQTAVINGHIEDANKHILPKLLETATAPSNQKDLDEDENDTTVGRVTRSNIEIYNQIAKFLELQGYKKEALNITKDVEQKFDLAIQLSDLTLAKSIMLNEICPSANKAAYTSAVVSDSTTVSQLSSVDIQHKWKQLSDLALNLYNFELMEESAVYAEDYSSLLLFYTAIGQKEKLIELAKLTAEKKRFNISFVCYLLCGRIKDCVSILISSGRVSEGLFLSRSYTPSLINDLIDIWKEELNNKISKKAANSIADPKTNPEMFKDIMKFAQYENDLHKFYSSHKPSIYYEQLKTEINLIVRNVLACKDTEGKDTRNVNLYSEILSLMNTLNIDPKSGFQSVNEANDINNINLVKKKLDNAKADELEKENLQDKTPQKIHSRLNNEQMERQNRDFGIRDNEILAVHHNEEQKVIDINDSQTAALRALEEKKAKEAAAAAIRLKQEERIAQENALVSKLAEERRIAEQKDVAMKLVEEKRIFQMGLHRPTDNAAKISENENKAMSKEAIAGCSENERIGNEIRIKELKAKEAAALRLENEKKEKDKSNPFGHTVGETIQQTSYVGNPTLSTINTADIPTVPAPITQAMTSNPARTNPNNYQSSARATSDQFIAGTQQQYSNVPPQNPAEGVFQSNISTTATAGTSTITSPTDNRSHFSSDFNLSEEDLELDDADWSDM